MSIHVNTPAHDAIDDAAARTISNFLDWLQEGGFTICRYQEVKCEGDMVLAAGYYPVGQTAQRMIVEFHGQDYGVWLAEKDAVLDAWRAQQEMLLPPEEDKDSDDPPTTD